MGALRNCVLDCLDAHGRVVATLQLAGSSRREGNLASILLDETTGEVRLRERETYDYRVNPESGLSLILMEDPGVQRDCWDATRGRIKLGDYCGTLILRLANADTPESPVATARITVRSVKMHYESHYRTMLEDIGRACEALLIESGSPTRLRLTGEWSRTPRVLEQQLELLRHLLDSPEFEGALSEVLRHPHRRLEADREERDISRPFRAGKDFGRQLASAQRRLPVPDGHPLRERGIASLPARVSVRVRHDDFDTAENRFIKHALNEYRDFLSDILGFVQNEACPGLGSEARKHVERETDRLLAKVEGHLSRGFLPDVDMPEILPLGSPVLQRKAGYRELFRNWLQFHAGASFIWDDASPDVFDAGARNVAKLYEYWLFFQLHNLFREKFTCDRPLHESLIEVNPEGFSSMSLKRGKSLKASGYRQDPKDSQQFRALRAELHFNRKFSRSAGRHESGSWTLGVQPDYTLSLWPARFGQVALDAEDAERMELMVHIHFDAKYRVENLAEILGNQSDDDLMNGDATEEDVGAPAKTMSRKRPSAKYQDLLKMHAYRDAIRRTAGAYVLYPGDLDDAQHSTQKPDFIEFPGFHEILPGLGAFAICPNPNGIDTNGVKKGAGIGALEKFIDEVIRHLCDRTTARERSTYHLAESYAESPKPAADKIKDKLCTYNALTLPEEDFLAEEFRAPPPADEMVLVAWYNNPAQLTVAMEPEGFCYVRLGLRAGSLQIHPNLAKVRRIILRAEDGKVNPGFLLLREVGFRIYTRTQLRNELRKKSYGERVAKWVQTSDLKEDDEYIYALFRTRPDPAFETQAWDGEKLKSCIEAFEKDRRNRLPLPVPELDDPINLGRTSPYPRILALRDVLKARA